MPLVELKTSQTNRVGLIQFSMNLGAGSRTLLSKICFCCLQKFCTQFERVIQPSGVDNQDP